MKLENTFKLHDTEKFEIYAKNQEMTKMKSKWQEKMQRTHQFKMDATVQEDKYLYCKR